MKKIIDKIYVLCYIELVNDTLYKIMQFKTDKEEKIMTRQEKMKIYRRRQMALIFGIAVVFSAIIVAVVMIFISRGSEKIEDPATLSSEYTDSISTENEEIPVDGGHKDSDGEFEFVESEITIEIDEEYEAILINKNEDKGVIWESSDSSVAIVDNGRIVGLSEGSCDITAKLESLGLSAKIRVYVESDEPEIVVKDGITYVDGILIANKTYSLPSDYYPDFLPETQAAFDEMSADAAAEGLNLYISSGFRSYDYQANLYNRYVSRDGKEAADRYSARPGHSEHQTGLAFDLNTIDESFEYTPEYEWVAANAHKYGFIIRYPKGKEEITGYIYESWHLRYLGVETATAVYESGLCLEEYLGIDSVYAEE